MKYTSRWYWKDGTPAITAEVGSKEWTQQMQKVEKKLIDRSYKVVKQETLANGYFVSTVWLGLDHSWTGRIPVIFETMVFYNQDNGREVDAARYPTEIKAQEGHIKMVKKWEIYKTGEGVKQ